MAVNRDDFSPTVKTSLAGRAGWRCSFPNCPASTAGPALESPDKWIKNGVAAHITAAAPGGPRYDMNLTSEQRSDISNGIWMCPTHGNLIDKESTAYTTDEIRAWKVAAESRATQAIERPHLNANTGGSTYTPKDTATLKRYTEIMSYETIKRIKAEWCGRFVSDEVINPLYELDSIRQNPRYSFQDAHLEQLRQTLHAEIDAFQAHFGQHSGGISGGYEFVDMGNLIQRDPSSEPYWREYVTKMQDLADKVCTVATQLLVLKENM